MSWVETLGEPSGQIAVANRLDGAHPPPGPRISTPRGIASQDVYLCFNSAGTAQALDDALERGGGVKVLSGGHFHSAPIPRQL